MFKQLFCNSNQIRNDFLMMMGKTAYQLDNNPKMEIKSRVKKKRQQYNEYLKGVNVDRFNIFNLLRCILVLVVTTNELKWKKRVKMSWEWSFFLNCVFHWLEINAVGFSYIIADWTWVKMLPILNRFHQIEMCQELFSLLFVLFSLSLSLHIYIPTKGRAHISVSFSQSIFLNESQVIPVQYTLFQFVRAILASIWILTGSQFWKWR